MELGELVKSKTSDTYGIINFSTFGYSVHFWNDDMNAYGKTIGLPATELLKYWEIIERLPDGYELNEHGIPMKIN